MTTRCDSFALCIGNESLGISVWKDDEATVVVNADGHRTTPAVVAFSEDGTAVIGDTAKRVSVKRPRETLHSLPFLLANRNNAGAIRKKRWGFEMDVNDDDQVQGFFTYPGMDPEVEPHKHSYVDAFKPLFTYAKGEVEAFLGNEVSQCVIVLPAYICEDKDAMVVVMAAAREAGLTIERVLRPDAATLLAHPQEGTSLVVDVGALSTTVTAVNVVNGLVRVEHSETTATGGRDVTQVAADYFATEFRKKTRMDLSDDKKAKRKLFFNADAAKQQLSVANEALVNIEALCNGVDFNGKLAQSRFDMLVNPLLANIKAAITATVEKASEKPSRVLLVGGATKTPTVKKFIDNLKVAEVLHPAMACECAALGAAEQSRACRTTNVGIPDDDVWAQAACGKAGASVDGIHSKAEVSALAKAVGIKGGNGAVKVLAPVGSLLPFATSLDLPAPAGKDAVLVELVEDDATVCKVPLSGIKGKTLTVTLDIGLDLGVKVGVRDNAGQATSFTC
eukprot:TRINITY_DN27796_c0_g1_i1.p1 TRINITY_DN27796_c0_g1~~TRINITY_DN27796_c0_g1_i1.p1  ORF type:complete len:507 (+),score=250.47 TRINITY_DN27796_c0_g1_i1:137-1657(+)